MAKSPVPGRVKTRLCPPCTFQEAAMVAEAALVDTLRAVEGTPVRARVVALEGEPGPWLSDGLVVRPQGLGTLDERIAHVFDDATGPTLLIGMDTPQVSATLLSAAVEALISPGVDAVFGEASDGGWWALGLRSPRGDLVRGVPMSTSLTGDAQRRRLARAGLAVVELPVLRDVDEIDDARAVASIAVGSSFAATMESLAFERSGARKALVP